MPREQAERLPVLREEVEWSRGNNNSPDSNVTEDLGDEGTAEGVGILAHHTFTKEGQPKATSELSYRQLNQPSEQDHAPSFAQPTQGKG